MPAPIPARALTAQLPERTHPENSLETGVTINTTGVHISSSVTSLRRRRVLPRTGMTYPWHDSCSVKRNRNRRP